MTAANNLADGIYDLPPGKLAEVVTVLEMLRPAAARSRERDDLRLRRVEAPQPGWYRDLFRHVGAPWLWGSRLALSDEALSAVIGHPETEVYALEHAGEDQGLLELDFGGPGVCEIAFFGLAVGLTGQGAGPWMMDRAVARAWSRPIDRLWLHTCTFDHPAALTFYVRSGFVPTRRQVVVADDPRRLGLLPLDAAPKVPLI